MRAPKSRIAADSPPSLWKRDRGRFREIYRECRGDEEIHIVYNPIWSEHSARSDVGECWCGYVYFPNMSPLMPRSAIGEWIQRPKEWWIDIVFRCGRRSDIQRNRGVIIGFDTAHIGMFHNFESTLWLAREMRRDLSREPQDFKLGIIQLAMDNNSWDRRWRNYHWSRDEKMGSLAATLREAQGVARKSGRMASDKEVRRMRSRHAGALSGKSGMMFQYYKRLAEGIADNGKR